MRERTGNKNVSAYGGTRGAGRVNPQPFFMAVGFYGHIFRIWHQKNISIYIR